MVGNITFSGLASGIDSASIIDQLISLERQPIRRLEQQQRTYDGQASKLRSMISKLESLRDAASGLEDRDDVLTSQATSSDEAVFRASVTGAPATGASSVHVTTLATAERTYSNTFAAKDQTGLFGTGTLSIQVGGDAAVDVTVDGSDTLESVVGKINGAGAAVSAGLVFDGTDWRIRVSGDDTGADREITFSETGTTLGLDDPANELQAATDAVFSIDDLAMTRSTNVISDAIPGVTLTLTGESPTADPATLSVERDPEALREKAQGFVDAYNGLMNAINAEFTYTGAPKGPTSLSGDATLRGLQSRMRSLIGSPVAGASGAYTTLASIGISTRTDGTLELDAAELEGAVADDPNAVATMLAGDGSGGTIEGFVATLDGAIEEYVDGSTGILSQRIDSLDGRKRDLGDQIDRLELRIEDKEEQLRSQFAALEQLVSGLQAQGNQMMAALVG